VVAARLVHERLARRLRIGALLVGDHALGEVDQLVAASARGGPQREAADERSAVALEGELEGS
jgi:hypothetical protein